MKKKEIKPSQREVNLKQLRDQLGLSQEDFARRLGVSVKTIFRWERGTPGEPRLTFSQFKKLALILEEMGFTVHDLPDRFGPSEN